MTAYDINGLRAMIVDDSHFMIKILTALFEVLGTRDIRGLTSPVDIFEQMTEWRPDLIVCDQMMQPISGLELIRKVRRNPASPNKYIPIILLTGHTRPEIVREARWHAGADAVLVKPVSAGRLLDCITSIYKSERVFVKAKDYFGPDRRNTDRPFEGEDRRASDIEEEVLAMDIEEEHILI